MPEEDERRKRADRSLRRDARTRAFTIDAARERLGNIGRTTVYGLIADGKLDAVKLGSRTLITAASVESLLQSLPRIGARLANRC